MRVKSLRLIIFKAYEFTKKTHFMPTLENEGVPTFLLGSTNFVPIILDLDL